MEKITVFDVAGYVLEKTGTITTMKLQKLVYYCQAWSLVWDDKPLFDEQIEAWVGGPVVRALYDYHKGLFEISSIPQERCDVSKFVSDQKETMNAVIDAYGQFSPHELSELTHAEDPWKEARKNMAPLDRGSNVITHESMQQYYQNLYYEQDKKECAAAAT